MIDEGHRISGAIHLGDMCRAVLKRAPEDIATGQRDPTPTRELIEVLKQEGRRTTRPDRWRSGTRYLLGYNTACLARNVEKPEGYFLSIPTVGFTDQRQALRQFVLTMLVYSAEVVLPLEASEPGDVPLDLSKAQPIDVDAATGLLTFAAELNPLLESNLLYIPVCHFYYDGIRFFRDRMDALARFGFCEPETLGDFFIQAGPELRTDIGLSLFCHADLSVDVDDVYSHICGKMELLHADPDHYSRYAKLPLQSERRALFFVRLEPITVPYFQPESIEQLLQLRRAPAIRRLHSLMEHVQLATRASLVDGRALIDFFQVSVNDELQRIGDELRLLGREHSISGVRPGVITLRHGVLLMELPTILPTFWSQHSFEIGFGAGSGLHGFSHWIDRRMAPTENFTVALIVRHIHLDE